MSQFPNLLRRAETLRRHETDPGRESWWVGYLRGLRYAHALEHGQRFGTEVEHRLYLAATDSTDPLSAALGSGYRAGLTLTTQEPT